MSSSGMRKVVGAETTGGLVSNASSTSHRHNVFESELHSRVSARFEPSLTQLHVHQSRPCPLPLLAPLAKLVVPGLVVTTGPIRILSFLAVFAEAVGFVRVPAAEKLAVNLFFE